MGYVFEELIRIGAEQSNEEAGEHFTPREVIKLMVNLLLSPEQDLRKSHVVKTIYDPACGTGGMLSVAEQLHPRPQRRRQSAPVRPGLERRVLGGLQVRHAHQGRGRRQHRPRRHLHQGRLRPRRRRQEAHLRLHARQPALRRGVEAAAEVHRARSRVARLQRPLRRRAAAHQRRLAALPAAHALEDARAQGGRQPHRHRLQRLAALHRRRRQRREQHPPVDHRERLAGGGGRAARPALLQHRHLDLRLGAHQPQGAPAARARFSSSTRGASS